MGGGGESIRFRRVVHRKVRSTSLKLLGHGYNRRIPSSGHEISKGQKVPGGIGFGV